MARRGSDGRAVGGAADRTRHRPLLLTSRQMAAPVDETTLNSAPSGKPRRAPARAQRVPGRDLGAQLRGNVQAQGRAVAARTRGTNRHPRARRRHLARARRHRARRRQDGAGRSGLDQRNILQRRPGDPAGPDRRRQDLDRRDDDPEVHLPGSGRRALPEAAVRIGAARRADVDLQPPLLHRPAAHGDPVRAPARASRWRCCSSTSTTSRRSTTTSATWPATACWRRSRA